MTKKLRTFERSSDIELSVQVFEDIVLKLFSTALGNGCSQEDGYAKNNANCVVIRSERSVFDLALRATAHRAGFMLRLRLQVGTARGQDEYFSNKSQFDSLEKANLLTNQQLYASVAATSSTDSDFERLANKVCEILAPYSGFIMKCANRVTHGQTVKVAPFFSEDCLDLQADMDSMNPRLLRALKSQLHAIDHELVNGPKQSSLAEVRDFLQHLKNVHTGRPF